MKNYVLRKAPFRSVSGMLKLLFSVMIFGGSILPVPGEVEYEIHAGYSTGTSCFGEVGGAAVLELRTYHVALGKLDALLDHFREELSNPKGWPRRNDLGSWVPVDNKGNLLIVLLAYRKKDGQDAKTAAMPEFDKEWIEKVDQVFVTPMDFSEGFAKIIPLRTNEGDEGAAEIPHAEHLFEMRTYTATPGHLSNLHARFREHTIDIFAKHGITNLAYFQLSPDQPGAENTLLYFLSHKDMESATKSWAAFRSDPEWIDAKMASEKEAGGSLTAEGGVKSIFLEPTDFSPVK